MSLAGDISIRRVVPDEAVTFARSVTIPFLKPITEDQVAGAAARLDLERAWLAWDGDRPVANAQIMSRTISLPAAPGRPCPDCPVAAVSSVGVHPTHRRRGILARLMAAMLDDAREREEPLTALNASEGLIYGRFGYGVSTMFARNEVVTARALMRPRTLTPASEVRLIEAAEARTLLPSLLESARRRRPGEVSRPDGSWANRWEDRPEERQGGSPYVYAVTDGGYAIYRVAGGDDWRLAPVRNRVIVKDLVTTTDEAAATLWEFLAGIDLVDLVQVDAPLDDPMRWRLADPRQWRTTAVLDGVWVRLLDLPAAFGARRYRQAGSLRFQITDHAGDAAHGCWELEVSEDGVGECRRAPSRDDSDLRLGLAEASSLFLGGAAATAMLSAGRVYQAREGAAAKADALLGTSPTPFNHTFF